MRRTPSAAYVLVALILVALNLRSALSSVPPLVSSIERDLELSGFALGLLTALPVLCMGLIAPAGHRLAHALGREASIAIAMGVLTLGMVLRLWGDLVALLYLGTVLAGCGIAVCGTVLPAIVKDYFAHRAGTVTGLYSAAMAIGAAGGAALAVPLEQALGSWRASLAVWSLPALVGLLFWLPAALADNEREPAQPVGPSRLPWRNRTAWLVTSYLALQSTAFYSTLAWLAPAHVDRGWSPRDAGLLLAAFALVQVLSAMIGPVLSDRRPDRRPVFLAAVLCSLLGSLGLLVVPGLAPWLVAILLGIGQGAGFALGLVLLVDYAPDPGVSSSLSAMAFLVGYTAAAIGPALLGLLFDVTGGFGVPFTVLLALTIGQLVVASRLRPGLAVTDVRMRRGRHRRVPAETGGPR